MRALFRRLLAVPRTGVTAADVGEFCGVLTLVSSPLSAFAPRRRTLRNENGSPPLPLPRTAVFTLFWSSARSVNRLQGYDFTMID